MFPNFFFGLALLAQDAAESMEALNRKAHWWVKLGNVVFGAAIALLVIALLITFWRRHVNKQKEREHKKAQVEEILAEEIEVKDVSKPAEPAKPS
ncbi:MAG: hypothetical protein MPJ50_02785 [Pirellulales bacterium]|nr:hypothetical protein [Pirellulales bacterium]